MQLDFTPDQDSLRDAVRSVLVKECPVGLVRSHVEKVVAGEQSSAGLDLYRTFAALDWPGLTVAETEGGVGLGVIELAILAEELGRVIAPGPLLTTIGAFVPLLRDAEGGSSWLKGVAAGTITGAVGLTDEGGVWSPDQVEASCSISSGEVVLRGTKRFVLNATDVDELAAVVRNGDGFAVAVVPTVDTKTTPVRALDASRPIADINFDDVRVPPERLLPITVDQLDHAASTTAVAFALEVVGTCQSIFDTNLAYAKERQQFGVPIGSFQAVKHKLANMFVAIERARAVCLFAAATIEEDDPRRPMASAMAKAAAGECQQLVTQDGIQLLGGIGYTWEHDQQLFVKRAKTSAALFGTAAEHRAVVARLLGI